MDEFKPHPPPPDNCKESFTPCWCASRPNYPHCKDVNSVPINSGMIIILVVLAIIIGFKYKLINTNNYGK